MPPFPVLLAATLAAGSACGLHLHSSLAASAPFIVSVGLLVSMLAHAHGRTTLRSVTLVVTGIAASTHYGATAAGRALNPSLRTTLDARFGGFAIESEETGRLETPVLVEGTLRQDAIRSENAFVLRLSIDRLWLDGAARAVSGGVSVGVGGTLAESLALGWTSGRRLRAPMLLGRPATNRNIGVEDQERALARRGIALVGAIKSGAVVELVAPGFWWEEWAAAVRAQVRATTRRWLAPRDPRAAAVAAAILIGDRAALSADVERTLQEAGTYHVVAISGGNVAIFAGLVLGALGVMGWRGREAAAVAIVTILAYGLVAEGGASVTRATTVAVIYLAVRLFDLRTPPAHALALSAAGMLLIDPLAVADVGFWLTFGASAGILLGAARVAMPRSWWQAVPLGLLLASIAVEAVLIPIAAEAFERVTVAGVLLNFAAIPSMTVVQVSAMGLVAADVLGFERGAAILAAIADLAASGLLDSARVVEIAPWVTWRVPPPAPSVTALYYMSLAAWWSSSHPPIETRRRRRLARASAVISLSLLCVIAVAPQSLIPAAGDARLRVTLLDVGQGDAILVTFPNGRTLLVDAGGLLPQGAFDIGDRIVGPALRARDIRRLDYLAITHGDPDHIGGARAVVRDFAPREVWVGVPVAGHVPSAMLRESADAAGVRATWRTLQRGDRMEIGRASLVVLHPPTPDWERQRVRNDDSLVLELRLGAFVALLTGDIGRAVERELVPLVTRAPLLALKVPHHGSATSSSEELLSALRPAIAIVGVGRGNVYGHPAMAVLERYRGAGTEVFRTDRDGQVDVSSDGEGVEVSTYSGRRSWKDNTKTTKVTKE